MNRTARLVLRRLDHDPKTEEEERQMSAAGERQAEAKAASGALEDVPEELLTESEKRHERYRRQQAMAGRFAPAAERLPIMTAEERQARDKNRPKWKSTEFEGPIEKLIEKYESIEEVKKHLTLGQSMKYEFTEDGRVLDRSGEVIFDGEKIVAES